uniref:Uncharacterized protein n=1 Tax=Arundo donax TaxID=35708 RepID=A0A0A9F9B8_ARUDO
MGIKRRFMHSRTIKYHAQMLSIIKKHVQASSNTFQYRFSSISKLLY